MNIPNLSKLKGAFNVGKAVVAAHRPEILLATSVVGGIASTILGAKGGWDARGIVEEEKVNRDDGLGVELTKSEIANLTWKCYVPAGVALVGSVGSTTGLHLVHVKEKKALVTAGAIALEEAREKFKAWEKGETVGVLSDDEKQAILEERAERVPIGSNRSSHIENTDGEIEEMYLVRDMRTGRDIWSNRHRIEDALIEVNNVLSGSGDVEVNHFYRHAGFGTLPEGNKFGWSGCLVGLEWDTTVRDDGRPVRTFSFQPSPETGFEPS